MVTKCFQQKSTLAKCLLVLLTLLIIVLIALFINLVIRTDEHICNSEQCIKTSAEIIRYLDQSVNPCDDYYNFACGSFLKNPISYNSRPDPEKELNNLIKEVVHSNDTRPLVMQKIFFQSCLDELAIENEQEVIILNLFFLLGDWPVLRGVNWNGTYFDWAEFAIGCRKLGLKFDFFLEFTVFEDVNNTRNNILKIDVPKTLGKLPEKEKSLRKKLFTEIAEFLGADKNLAHYETGAAIEFGEELGKIADMHRRRIDGLDTISPTKVLVGQLEEYSPFIKWRELINNITGKVMSRNDYVYFDIFDYIKDLNQLIMGTPKRLVADYLMWKMIEQYHPYLSREIRRKFEVFYLNTTRRHPKNRMEFCLDASKKQFPLIVDSVYIRRHVTEQKRLMVREMLFIIQGVFTRTLEHASWMNRDAKKRALIKIQKLRFLVGGPDEIYDEFKFAENLGVYGFQYRSKNVIDMVTQRSRRYYDVYFSVLNRRVLNNTDRYYEKTVNVSNFVVINDNTLVIPAAALRDPLYSPNLPNYLNYGTLGKMVAHEIFKYIYQSNYTEALDDNSYDDKWYIHQAFEDSVRCLTKDASFYQSPEYRKPTKVKENLAYFVANDMAFEAYKEWSRMLPQELNLPALKYTPNQLFWIQANRVMCGTNYDRQDSRYKILAPLRNSYRFAAEHLCAKNAKMNPIRKCNVL